VVGAELAGAGKEQITLLKSLGEHLGIAYQLTDDLLGVFGEEARTGKSASNDLQEGKRTRLLELFATLATEEQKAAVEVIRQPFTVTPELLAAARQAILASGAEQQVRDEIARLSDRAIKVLEALQLSAHDMTTFRTLIAQLSERKA
jgi:geranylgeranyl diphosphate synthase type I